MDDISLQTRLDVNDLLVRYCHEIDDRNWAELEALFIPDAHLDFSAFRGPCGNTKDLIEFFQAVANAIPRWQHTISTSRVFRLDDTPADQVKVRTAAQVMMITLNEKQQESVSFSGLWYDDTLIKTGKIWRFAARKQVYGWTHPNPNA